MNLCNQDCMNEEVEGFIEFDPNVFVPSGLHIVAAASPWRAGLFDRDEFDFAFDTHLGHVEPDRPAYVRLMVFEPSIIRSNKLV